MTQALPTALIIDDEADILTLLGISLERMGIQTHKVSDLAQARAALASQSFDFCLTDMRLPDGNGLDLVREISVNHPGLPVAVITAHGDMQSAIDALKSGAFDFVNKPLDLVRLRDMVETALRLNPAKPNHQTHDQGADRLIGQTPVMRQLRAQIAKVARSQAPVFIHGESGTGKEVIARLIHDLSPRCDKPFLPINCGAIPSELMESEFFGHRKGSFTGANSDKKGLFQAAKGGTLFLDEVAELPLSMQVKLLRALQERAVRPVGASFEEAVDVRIISATHKNLAQRVQAGEFRQDLFYRLNVIQLDAPPLRERCDDIPLLASHILQRLAERDAIPPRQLEPSATHTLMSYDFPGNVRELENILERTLALGEEGSIQASELSFPTSAASAFIHDTAAAQTNQEAKLQGNGSSEEHTLIQTLETHRWNRTRAAEALGLTLRQLRYRLEKMGLK
ncbi:MAG: sigma-54 dependent transcriptional regulator [Halothiobacillaceae bacterium]|nr:sigma-54 dependent transcriptional regulator [Halothiobacillaceae bacterium]